MYKTATIFLFITSFVHPVTGQTNQSSYSAFINLATSPSVLGFNGRLFKFHSDSLLVMDRSDYRQVNDSTYIDIYDTTYYPITDAEKQKIITTIKSVDSLESIYNFCMMDGLRFYFSCSYDSIEHHAWVSNAYDSRIFMFLDIINAHVPYDLQIRYNKDGLVNEEKKCLKERFGINK